MKILRHINNYTGLRWIPTCNACLAELALKDGTGFCVFCGKVWDIGEHEIEIIEHTEPERPDPTQVAAATRALNPDTGNEATAKVAPTPDLSRDEILSQANDIFNGWWDEYTNEGNANPIVVTQAAIQFLAELLTEIALRDPNLNAETTLEAHTLRLRTIFNARCARKQKEIVDPVSS